MMPKYLSDWLTKGKLELGIARQRSLREARAAAAMRGKHTELKRRTERARQLFNT